MTILEKAGSFLDTWTAHKNNLHASFDIRYDCLLVFAVDEKVNDASGCSIDKLFSFIKELDQYPGLDLLNRMKLAFTDTHQDWKVVSISQGRSMINDATLHAETTVLDLSIKSIGELSKAPVQLQTTWLKQYLAHAE